MLVYERVSTFFAPRFFFLRFFGTLARMVKTIEKQKKDGFCTFKHYYEGSHFLHFQVWVAPGSPRGHQDSGPVWEVFGFCGRVFVVVYLWLL